ncbi:phosphate/phosphite/phosphonate ABC transporter substrate-binding protein [Chloroflexus sp.]|uniref:substrate-binding domain-containing protein n=1 Tax=Chloroflexus sp. TaxID=1904827 RepID=UPI002ACDE4D4|nr:phosphate/phosphite/phosphonate ABC transporter substrate-binding protein [Chloroflexus sp.]
MVRQIRWLILTLLFIGACGNNPSAPIISLNNLQPLPAPTPVTSPPLRVSVASVVSPQGTVQSYQPLLDYLSAHLGRQVVIVQRRTYSETNELIGRNEVDIAFVCTSAYIDGRDRYGMQLLVAPQVNGETVYHSLLIVPAHSAARSMADLRGKTFAFTDPTSFSGRVYPTALVQQLGATPERFFHNTFFTYSHDTAIEAVANGLADGAAVDSLVFNFAIARNPTLADAVKVIHTSPPFGIPPVVTASGVRPQLRAELQTILLGMADDPSSLAQTALAVLGIERFVMIDDAAYASARLLRSQVGDLVP